MIRKILYIMGFLLTFTACGQENDIGKEDQTITFDNLPAQISIVEGSLPLTASATSGLFVTFTSSDESVAVIEKSQAIFRQPGIVSITASQAGNERFHEATNVVRTFEILSVDITKREQTISFDLVNSWKSSSGALLLNATASSGLPVQYTSSDETVVIVSGGYLILEHYYEARGETPYTKQIAITASQAGNSEYNPAANATRWISAIIDVVH
jgi:hypothetical protein